MSTRTQLKARQLREAEARSARSRRVRADLAVAAGALVIVGLLVAIVVVAINSSHGPATATSNAGGALVVPKTATGEGALLVGRADAPVTLEVFLDFRCPYCGRFEAANATEVSDRVGSGQVKLLLHPLAFLDRVSAGSRYSTRTANALVTVAERAPQQLFAFQTALFAAQPAEGTTGLGDDEIARLATGAGVPAEVAAGFTALTYEPWVAQTTRQAFDGGISGTPTVRIDGRQFTGDLYDAGPLGAALDAAVAAAASGR